MNFLSRALTTRVPGTSLNVPRNSYQHFHCFSKCVTSPTVALLPCGNTTGNKRNCFHNGRYDHTYLKSGQNSIGIPRCPDQPLNHRFVGTRVPGYPGYYRGSIGTYQDGVPGGVPGYILLVTCTSTRVPG
eukprot:338917-Rhodomonas_salina.1